MANSYTATLTDTDGAVVQVLALSAADDVAARNQLTAAIAPLTAEDAGNIGTWTLVKNQSTSVSYP